MDNNRNLLTEVLNLLEKNNKSWEDVTDVFITGKYNIGKNKFYELAGAADYKWNRDEINKNLIIKGTDFIINVNYTDGFRTYLDFIDLRVPKKYKNKPVLFTWFEHKHIVD